MRKAISAKNVIFHRDLLMGGVCCPIKKTQNKIILFEFELTRYKKKIVFGFVLPHQKIENNFVLVFIFGILNKLYDLDPGDICP
ncbi:MAG: hypothetical protein QF711_03795, partial [SAR324 cluster bacterium]|nr:hypothetical protein [SAR324 cluster bacterium]